jgi:hypothetical protein
LITLTDEQFKVVKHIKNWFTGSKRRFPFILAGLAGTGKAQPLDCKIMTDTGYRSMGEMTIGNKIFGSDGKLHNVVGVYPQGKKDVYEIEFSCGEKTKCCEDHLWNYQTKPHRDQKKGFSTTSLKHLRSLPLTIKSGSYDAWNLYIPMTTPLEFDEVPIPIPAYIFGLFLGEGGFTTGVIKFSNPEQDIITTVQQYCTSMGLSFNFSAGCTWSVVDVNSNRSTPNFFTSYFKEFGQYGLKSEYKFIPDIYKYNSVQKRIDLLSGLIDSDGEVNGSCYNFSSTSLQLTNDVKWLVESLGGTATFEERQTYFNDTSGDKKAGLPSYRLHIKMPRDIQVFKSEKHKSKFRLGQTGARRTIRSITYIGQEECQCIMTDNPTGLYLTDHCIVTHNTTIIRNAADELGIPEHCIRYCAFTGKAAMVMRSKGMSATTIHSLIYEPITDPETKKVTFVKKANLGGSVSIIICDESSMIGKEIQTDLESYGIPILYVGDHGQLPPVSSDTTNLMLNPHCRLETIHRQALDNPIIWIANQARQGKYIKHGKYGNTVLKTTEKNVGISTLKNADQIICGKNITRTNINKQMRAYYGFTSIFPEINDKVICLKNNNSSGLVNGMGGKCVWFDERKMRMDFVSDEGDRYSDLMVDYNIFQGKKSERYIRMIDQFDFAYCITCHKSQGSQYENVVIYEERLGFEADLHNRWLYTAITRASERLVIIG